MPFLTLEDPRAKIKGSRDPLGFVPIWSGFGRRLVGNLTTATESVRGFTVLLLGRWYAERLLREERITDEDVLPVFQRVEQIFAYVRHANTQGRAEIAGYDVVRGIDRVRRRWDESGTRVPIQANSDGFILADQKVYGLWGLYTVASRVSGLVEDGPIGLSTPAREFVEQAYAPVLRPLDAKLLPLVTRGGWLQTRANDPTFRALKSLLPAPVGQAEADWYAEWMRDAQHVSSDNLPPGRQARLVELLASHTDLTNPVNREELETLRQHAETVDPSLARAIHRVLALEAVLVPAEAIFAHLQSCHGQSPRQVSQTFQDRWGHTIPHIQPVAIEELLGEVRARQGEEIAEMVRLTTDAFAAADYQKAIRVLLSWNDVIMKSRGGAPWVTLDTAGQLDVAYSAAERLIPDGDELAERWYNPYFLNSLKHLTWQLEMAQ